MKFIDDRPLVWMLLHPITTIRLWLLSRRLRKKWPDYYDLSTDGPKLLTDGKDG